MRRTIKLSLFILLITVFTGCSSPAKAGPYQTCIDNYKAIDTSRSDLVELLKEIVEAQPELTCSYTVVEEIDRNYTIKQEKSHHIHTEHRITTTNHDRIEKKLTLNEKQFDEDGRQFVNIYHDYDEDAKYYTYTHFSNDEWSVREGESYPLTEPRYNKTFDIPFETLYDMELVQLTPEEMNAMNLPPDEQFIIIKGYTTSNDLSESMLSLLDKPLEGDAIYEVTVNANTGVLHSITLNAKYEIESPSVLEKTKTIQFTKVNEEQTYIDRSEFPDYSDVYIGNESDTQVVKDYLRTAFDKMSTELRSASFYIYQHVTDHRVKGTIMERLFNNTEMIMESFFEQNIDDIEVAVYSHVKSGNNESEMFMELDTNKARIYNEQGGRWTLAVEGAVNEISPEYIADEMNIDFVKEFQLDVITSARVYYSDQGVIIKGDYPDINYQSNSGQANITNKFKMIIDPATHYLKYFEMALDSPNMTTIQKVSINKINETKVTMTKDDVLPAYFEQYRLPMEATE